ncbi:Platinum sensitivity protein, partial [Spiromyces aspiralis]
MLNDIPRLPEPEPGNLVEIRQALMRSRQYIYRREQLAGYLVSEDYIKKLVQMYEIFTDLEDTDSLEMLCDILQNIVILNDASIIEYMIRDDIIFDLVGILEYDPRFQPNSRPNYRDTLKSIKFKQ